MTSPRGNPDASMERAYRIRPLSIGTLAPAIRGRVVGTAGLYVQKGDARETAWVGWLCADPDVRGRGLGKRLLELVVETARREGKTTLRLYTSTLPDEASAQFLYDRLGFRVVERKDSGKGFTYLFREKALDR